MFSTKTFLSERGAASKKEKSECRSAGWIGSKKNKCNGEWWWSYIEKTDKQKETVD